jgi:chromate transporter
VFAAPFPLVIAAAAVIGYFRAPAPLTPQSVTTRINWRQTAATTLLWLAIWLLPIALIILILGSDHVFTAIALFFSKLAVMTFGGAYAVLSYMAQQAVETHHWLTAGEMVDGLGLAETTPGPLILVTEFVGYLAGYRSAGGVWGGIAGAALTLWVTFAPCFLWIFAGAPYIERLGTMPRLSGALAAITAAVVGVILNLSVWFGLHVLFASVTRTGWGPVTPWLPDVTTLDPWALILTVIAAVALLRFHLSIALTLAVAAAAGLAMKLLV